MIITKNNKISILQTNIQSQYINLCFCTNINYCWFTFLSIKSIINTKKKTTKLKIFILAEQNFIYTHKQYFNIFQGEDVKIIFYEVNNKIFKINLKTSIYKNEIFYRFYITDLLPKNIDRVIYIDSDTIIQQDLSDLFNLNIDNYAFGAVYEFGIMSYFKYDIDVEIFKKFKYLKKFNEYYNSGVLLCNLKFLRNDNFRDKCINEYKNNPEYYFVDQDIINSLYSDKYIKSLSYKFNFCFIPLIREDRLPTHTLDIFNKVYNQSFTSIQSAIKNAVILHFAFDKNLCSSFTVCKKMYDYYTQQLLIFGYLYDK